MILKLASHDRKTACSRGESPSDGQCQTHGLRQSLKEALQSREVTLGTATGLSDVTTHEVVGNKAWVFQMHTRSPSGTGVFASVLRRPARSELLCTQRIQARRSVREGQGHDHDARTHMDSHQPFRRRT